MMMNIAMVQRKNIFLKQEIYINNKSKLFFVIEEINKEIDKVNRVTLLTDDSVSY